MISKNRQEIANKYAAENNFDSAEIIATRDDDAYYRLYFKNRPRYTGYPDVIKISSSGKVSIVLDKNEIYWAIRQSK